ncbi:MAG: RcnB family protein [Rhodocyclaceae bacterium]|nr:RcnB family protein [Rhodocyclaceae bacterium]
MKLRLASPLLLALSLSLATAPAFADKPDWAGGGKHDKAGHDDHGKGHKGGKKHGGNDDGHGGRHGGSDVNISIGAYFGGTQRSVVHDYYGAQFRAGHCPRGLAKKNNGCMPPGQAKQWRLGARLPHDLTYHAVPGALVTRLGPPPAGHKYVRVASDILLIAIGTSMVVDAIEDLGGL